MDTVCFALPVVPGKTDSARSFMRELDGPRKEDFASSERRIGVTKESWYLQNTPQGNLLLAYIESPNFASALAQFSQSRDAFDIWFKDRMREITGVDFNQPPPGPLSERLSSYVAA